MVRNINWLSLAEREIRYSRIGGTQWRQFVKQAEIETGLPWHEIRNHYQLECFTKELISHHRIEMAS